MSTHQYLSDEDFGRLYLQSNDVAPGADVLDIEPRVQAWLDRADMAHRNAFAIAVQAVKLARKEPAPAPLPSPAEADQGWQRANREGYGKPSDAELAAQVASWDLATYSRERARLGVYKSTLDFLSGS